MSNNRQPPMLHRTISGYGYSVGNERKGLDELKALRIARRIRIDCQIDLVSPDEAVAKQAATVASHIAQHAEMIRVRMQEARLAQQLANGSREMEPMGRTTSGAIGMP